MIGKRRRRGFSININLSNKFAYTLILVLSVILLGVGVYAYGGSAPSTMGHSLGEIALPSCSPAEALYWDGNNWICKLFWAPTDIKLTTAMHNGNFGGYKAMYDWIQTNGCAGYHVCDAAEITRAIQAGLTPATPPGNLYDGGWYNGGLAYSSGSRIMTDCNGWTFSTNDGVHYGQRWYDNIYSPPPQFPDSWGCWGNLPVYCCK